MANVDHESVDLKHPYHRIVIETARQGPVRVQLVNLQHLADGRQLRRRGRGEKALQILRIENFDCVLLDVNMPGIGGLETLRRIRVFAPRLPVLILTVRDGEDEKVRALEMGADDYVTKPFGVRELVARMRAAVRRVHAPVRTEEEPVEIGEIRLVPARRSVTRRGQAIHLTRKEFDILHCLMSRAGRVVTYARLLTAVWGADCREEVEYLRTFVRQLRKKIEDDPARPVYLLTDIYVGYRFADAQMLEEAQAAANEPIGGFSTAGPETLSGPGNSSAIGHA